MNRNRYLWHDGWLSLCIFATVIAIAKSKSLIKSLTVLHQTLFKLKNTLFSHSRTENTETFFYDTVNHMRRNELSINLKKFWVSSRRGSDNSRCHTASLKILLGQISPPSFYVCLAKRLTIQSTTYCSILSLLTFKIVPLGRDVFLFLRRTTINRARRRTCARTLRSDWFSPAMSDGGDCFDGAQGLKWPVFFGAFHASVLRFDHEFHTLVVRRAFNLSNEENVVKLLTFASRPS